MAELFATPVLEIRWAKVVGDPEPNKWEPTKPPTWSIEALIDPQNPEHMQWVASAEDHFAQFHGDQGKKSVNWLAIGPDKEDRTRLVAKFKMPQFTRKDGTTSPGPTVMDARKQPWPHNKLIGNGSKARIGYTVYAWKTPTGQGITMQPTHVQIIELIEYSSGGAPSADPFQVEQTGYKLPDADANCPMPGSNVVITEPTGTEFPF